MWHKKAYTTFCGSFLLFTGNPFSHFSFFLLGNCVVTSLELAWVGRISHHGASGEEEKDEDGWKMANFISSNISPQGPSPIPKPWELMMTVGVYNIMRCVFVCVIIAALICLEYVCASPRDRQVGEISCELNNKITLASDCDCKLLCLQ